MKVANVLTTLRGDPTADESIFSFWIASDVSDSFARPMRIRLTHSYTFMALRLFESGMLLQVETSSPLERWQ
jgi:hypothetical protein